MGLARHWRGSPDVVPPRSRPTSLDPRRGGSFTSAAFANNASRLSHSARATQSARSARKAATARASSATCAAISTISTASSMLRSSAASQPGTGQDGARGRPSPSVPRKRYSSCTRRRAASGAWTTGAVQRAQARSGCGTPQGCTTDGEHFAHTASARGGHPLYPIGPVRVRSANPCGRV